MFISEEEFKNLDYKTLHDALERVHNKAIEATLKLMPEVIIGLIIKSHGMKQIFESFKDKHPELAGKEEEIIEIIQEIELEDGSLDLSYILQKVPEKIAQRNLPIPESQPHTIEEAGRTANGFI